LRGELTARLPHPDPAKAEDSFRTALAIAREQGSRGYELRAAVSLARLRRDHGRHAEARDLLAPVYGWFTEGFGTLDLIEAKELLKELQRAARSGSRELPGSERRRQPTRSGA
jgi:predicted ATPase